MKDQLQQKITPTDRSPECSYWTLSISPCCPLAALSLELVLIGSDGILWNSLKQRLHAVLSEIKCLHHLKNYVLICILSNSCFCLRELATLTRLIIQLESIAFKTLYFFPAFILGNLYQEWPLTTLRTAKTAQGLNAIVSWLTSLHMSFGVRVGFCVEGNGQEWWPIFSYVCLCGNNYFWEYDADSLINFHKPCNNTFVMFLFLH